MIIAKAQCEFGVKLDISVPDKKQLRADETDRVAEERKFSEAKGFYGLGMIRNKLKTTSETAIAQAIAVLNIAHIERVLRASFWQWIGFGKLALVRQA